MSWLCLLSFLSSSIVSNHLLFSLSPTLSLSHHHSPCLSLPLPGTFRDLSDHFFFCTLYLISVMPFVSLNSHIILTNVFLQCLSLTSLVLSVLWAQLHIVPKHPNPSNCVCVDAVVVMHGQSWSLVLAHVDGRLSLPPKCFGNTRDLLSCHCN